MTKMVLMMLHKALDTIPERAEKEGITPKELYDRDIKDVIWEKIKEISDDLNKLPIDLDGRDEIFEMYEQIIEVLESYDNMK
jgi:hypothetical protein